MFEALHEIDKELSAVEERKERVRAEIIAADHPLQYGEAAECNTGVSHVGKQFIVDVRSIKARLRPGVGVKYRFFASGRIIRQDGTTGSHRGSWEGE